MEEKKNVLEGVKVGDELVYSQWNSLNRIVTVTKVRKTQVECSNNGKYRISDGYEVGGDKWCRSSVRFPKDGDEIQNVKNGLLAVRYVRAIKEDVDYIASRESTKQTAIGLDTLKEIYNLVHNIKEILI
jgi:hypothetical protein